MRRPRSRKVVHSSAEIAGRLKAVWPRRQDPNLQRFFPLFRRFAEALRRPHGNFVFCMPLKIESQKSKLWHSSILNSRCTPSFLNGKTSPQVTSVSVTEAKQNDQIRALQFVTFEDDHAGNRRVVMLVAASERQNQRKAFLVLPSILGHPEHRTCGFTRWESYGSQKVL
jgi:hypothetical protein